eukprot:scaffold16814_cov69-Phaeocystis_antarctica.AAC.13
MPPALEPVSSTFRQGEGEGGRWGPGNGGGVSERHLSRLQLGPAPSELREGRDDEAVAGEEPARLGVTLGARARVHVARAVRQRQLRPVMEVGVALRVWIHRRVRPHLGQRVRQPHGEWPVAAATRAPSPRRARQQRAALAATLDEHHQPRAVGGSGGRSVVEPTRRAIHAPRAVPLDQVTVQVRKP